MGQPDPTRNPIDPTRPARFAMSNQNSRPNEVIPSLYHLFLRPALLLRFPFFFFFLNQI